MIQYLGDEVYDVTFQKMLVVGNDLADFFLFHNPVLSNLDM